MGLEVLNAQNLYPEFKTTLIPYPNSCAHTNAGDHAGAAGRVRSACSGAENYCTDVDFTLNEITHKCSSTTTANICA